MGMEHEDRPDRRVAAGEGTTESTPDGLSAGLARSGDAARHDVIFSGGAVIAPGDGDVTEIAQGYVAVRDGRISAVGPLAEAGDLVADERIDTTGQVVLPGFVNAHTHMAMVCFRGLADDVDLHDFLTAVTTAESAELDPPATRVAARDGATEMLAGGTTSACEMYFFHDAVAAGARDAGLDIHTGATFITYPNPDTRDFGTWLRETRAELAAARAAGDQPMLCPHSTYGLEAEHLQAIGELAAEFDARIHVHASETQREVDDVVAKHGASPIQVLKRYGLLGPRTVLAHAVVLDDADIALIAVSGASVAHCPWSNLKLACGVARVPDLREAGVNVALGTDGAVSSNSLDMWLAVRLAATLHKGVTRSPRVVSAGEAIAMATSAGGRALGDPLLGTLEVGAPANLQVLDVTGPHLSGRSGLVARLAYAATAADVRDVYVAGRRVTP